MPRGGQATIQVPAGRLHTLCAMIIFIVIIIIVVIIIITITKYYHHHFVGGKMSKNIKLIPS